MIGLGYAPQRLREAAIAGHAGARVTIRVLAKRAHMGRQSAELVAFVGDNPHVILAGELHEVRQRLSAAQELYAFILGTLRVRDAEMANGAVRDPPHLARVM